jgi:hypothetical protein
MACIACSKNPEEASTYWMNFAREIVAEKDGLVETLLMYEQLQSWK